MSYCMSDDHGLHSAYDKIECVYSGAVHDRNLNATVRMIDSIYIYLYILAGPWHDPKLHYGLIRLYIYIFIYSGVVLGMTLNRTVY